MVEINKYNLYSMNNQETDNLIKSENEKRKTDPIKIILDRYLKCDREEGLQAIKEDFDMTEGEKYIFYPEVSRYLKITINDELFQMEDLQINEVLNLYSIDD